MGNGFFTVCGIVKIDGKIVLVRHTYGTAKNRILCPGGYIVVKRHRPREGGVFKQRQRFYT